MENPFTLGIVQDGDEFCNREKERADLVRYAGNSANVVLCSPRRYGKSSLTTVVLNDLRKQGFLTVYVDLFPIASEHDFITRFASAVFKSMGHGVDPRSLAEKFKGIFSSIRPVIELVPDEVSISAKYDRSAKHQIPLDDLMEGIARYVKKSSMQACIVLDEFQEITELNESKKIEGTLRSHIQFQKRISYFFVGSRRRILLDMFNSRSRPFYKSAYMYVLKPIPADEFIPYVERRFAGTGKVCVGNTAELIYGKARGYPYYVQKLASIAWDATDKECTKTIVDESFNLLVRAEALDFDGIWSGITLAQRAMLKAIAVEHTSAPFAKDFLEEFGLSIGGAQKSLKMLITKDLVEKSEDGVYMLTDPIMEAWLVKA